MQTSLKLKESLKLRIPLLCCPSLIAAGATFAQQSPLQQAQQSSATGSSATTQPRSPTREVVGQNTTAAPAATPVELNEIVVTSTRIVRDGYQAPTPTSVIGEEEIAAKAPANIADFVNELP